jgi:hypothetical protein
MALDTVGILTPVDFSTEQVTVLKPEMREVFVNETPLVARLPRNPAKGKTYQILTYDVRQRNYLVGTGGMASSSATSLPVADASPFWVGDVLELTPAAGGTAERVEVLQPGNLTATPNTLTVRRGVDGTTAASSWSAADLIKLIGNSRTGGEIDQQASRAVRSSLTQIVQTFQASVQVGGEAEALGNVALPPGADSLFGLERAIKLTELMRDEEYTSYYGNGQIPSASGDRGKQKGLRALIKSYNGGANVKTGAGGSYTIDTFLADTVDKIVAAGGMPDAVLCSASFITGLRKWAPNQVISNGNDLTDALGLPIRRIVLAIGGYELTFIASLQLEKGTAAVVTSDDLDLAVLRDEFWQPRGNRGDAMEGDWISSLCINLGHPQFHAWVEGITSLA